MFLFSSFEWDELVVWVKTAAVGGYMSSCDWFCNFEDVTVMYSLVQQDPNKFKPKISFKNLTSVLPNR
jgi:hypothetical protein